MLVSDDRDGGGVEHKAPPLPRVEAQAHRRDHPQDVPVREQQHVATGSVGPGEHPLCACGHLIGALALRHLAIPDRPSRHALADVVGGHTLVGAVVPLVQVGVSLGVGEPRERRRLTCPGEGARQHQ